MNESKIRNVIIIGASHGGSQAAISLRQSGWEGGITIIGDEDGLPYQRPPLSKEFMSGQKSFSDILIRNLEVYKSNQIDLILGTIAKDIDRQNKIVRTISGRELPYDKLIISTGARVRKLNIPGADHDKVFYLRDINDVRSIKAEISKGKSAVIIGGGYIGLETAASLSKQGVEVTLLEAMDRILQRVTAPIVSDFYRRVHTNEGVKIVENTIASNIEDNNGVMEVISSDGNRYSADFVIVGIGVIPNSELASEAKLCVGNGIEVNEYCQTNDYNIYAIGDVSWHYNPIYDTHIRLESVPNATDQAKTAALHICGSPKPYNSLPWFWSDQFDLKLQIAGISIGYDNIVVRDDPNNERKLAVFYFQGEEFLAVDAINDPRSFVFSRMALTGGKKLDKEILANPKGDLKLSVVS